jgi:alkane 1-monooxygenase
MFIMTPRAAPLLFASASLVPAFLLILAAGLGGIWAYAALFSITAAVVILDRIGVALEAAVDQANWLAFSAGAAHFAVLGGVLAAIADRSHLDPPQLVALLLAVGLYIGQVSNACAHELIHRHGRGARLLGTAIYCSILNGQHVSAHLLVHHVHAGTPRDPNSAPLGRGFYRYMLHATWAEFRAGWQAETRRRQGRSMLRHPYLVYLGGGGLSLLAAFQIAGLKGVAVLAGLSLHAQMQLLLSDYLQHYGLHRRKDATGRLEPMGPQHSWNAPQSHSAAMMLNAPLHSDHHMNPARPFPALRHDPTTMPTLPYSVPVMGAIALVPPLWRRIMTPRALKWSASHGKVMPSTPARTGSPRSLLPE